MSHACKPSKADANLSNHKTILLMGLPNVGKSAIFSRYTGLDVMVSNYSGTTVEYTEGRFQIDETTYRLIDVPGVYNIHEHVDDAEAVAVKMLNDKPDGIICVLDSMNLEASVHLLMHILEYNIPTVVALNRNDLSKEKGYRIDHRVIQSTLNVPVIPTVAIGGSTLELLKLQLKETMAKAHVKHVSVKTEAARWEMTDKIMKEAVKKPVDAESYEGKHAYLVKPWPGLLIAILVLGLLFGFVIGFGMGLRQYLLLPFFEGLIFPFIISSVETLITHETIKLMLIGEYGFLIKGLEWPFALVLPYVISFYTMMSLLEDSGYLPRLAVLLDGILKKIGLTGSSIIPLLLGYGCGIPAIMGTRSLPSKKSRLTVAVMVSFAIPCVSQTGAFISLLVEHSLLALVMVFVVSILALIIVGFVMDKIQKKAVPLTLMSLPELLVPKPKIFGKKVYVRVKHYIKDGAIPMIIAIGFTAFFYEIGVLTVIGQSLSPVVSGWLRLPEEAATPLILGIVRRELAVLPLIDMSLTTLQFFTAAVVALFYVPCIAMIATLAKEFNLKTAIGILIFTTFTAVFIGGIIARVGALLIGS